MEKQIGKIEAIENVEGIPQDFYYQTEIINLKPLATENHKIRLLKHYDYCIGFSVKDDSYNSEIGLNFQEDEIIPMLPNNFLSFKPVINFNDNFLPIEFYSKNEVVEVRTRNFENISKTLTVVFLLSNVKNKKIIPKIGVERIKVTSGTSLDYRLNIDNVAKKINKLRVHESAYFDYFTVEDKYLKYIDSFHRVFQAQINQVSNIDSMIPVSIDNMDLYIHLKNVNFWPPVQPYVWFIYFYDDFIDSKRIK